MGIKKALFNVLASNGYKPLKNGLFITFEFELQYYHLQELSGSRLRVTELQAPGKIEDGTAVILTLQQFLQRFKLNISNNE